MSVRLNDIMDRLVLTIQAVNGTGSYTYDLSATGRVFVAGGIPDGAPDLCVWLVQGSVNAEPAGLGAASLTRWKWTANVAVNGFVRATADTPYARIVAANKLYADLWRALMANRKLNTGSADLVIDMTLSEMQALEGGIVNAAFAGQGVCAFVVTLTWQESSAA